MLIPIFIALIGTIILNIGFVLQKSEASQLPSFTPTDIKLKLQQIVTCRKWILGTTLTTTGWLFFLIAIAVAPLTVIAPLSNAGVVVLAGIAYFYLQESLHVYEWMGFIAILLGVVFIPIFSTSKQVDIKELDAVLLLLMTSIFIVGMIFLVICQKLLFPLKNGSVLGILSGITAGMGSAFTKMISFVIDEFILLVMTLILVGIFQILSFITLQTAFQQERATIIVPLFNSFATLLPLIYGILIFSEVVPIGQMLGIIMIVLGASALFQFSGEDFSKKLQGE